MQLLIEFYGLFSILLPAGLHFINYILKYIMKDTRECTANGRKSNKKVSRIYNIRKHAVIKLRQVSASIVFFDINTFFHCSTVYKCNYQLASVDDDIFMEN